MTLSRRRLLGLAAAGGAGLALPSGCGLVSGGPVSEAEGSAGTLLTSGARLPEPFRVPLPVPPTLKPVRGDGGADHYDIVQKTAQAEILPGYKTEVWGYNGTFPGPTIESRRGRRTVVAHRNDLPVPAVVHLHGGKTPAAHDGYPTDAIEANDTREYVYPIDQPAATLWYHDHRMDFTGPQVYRGLAGFHLIRDDEEAGLGLPYGERDIPLMIADRAFAEDGSFAYPSMDPSLTGMPGVKKDFMSGVLGDCILVNGAPWPELEVTATRYRFRILNASNARRYELTLDPAPPGGTAFVQIGSDQGLLRAPVRHETLHIAQAERFDVVIDFSKYRVGDKITLVNNAGSGGTAQVMRFVVARRGRDDSRVPSRLVDFRPLSRSEVTVERDFVFARGGAQGHHGVSLWTVNGKKFEPDRITARPKLGAVELWRLRARNVPHPVHIHLTPFQVISGDQGDGDVGPYNRGWKDTVNLGNGGRAEVLIKFDGYRGRYVFHCHNLEHEDMMMMANFEVV
ncbi:MAG: multicopper oxidase family protein [Micromonosporaceae bacterium]